jgi:hypothetical protein
MEILAFNFVTASAINYCKYTYELRIVRWAGHVACVGAMRNACRTFIGKGDGKRQPKRPRHRGKDNIKMCHREIGFGGLGWIHLAQDRYQWRPLVNTVMNFLVP